MVFVTDVMLEVKSITFVILMIILSVAGHSSPTAHIIS